MMLAQRNGTEWLGGQHLLILLWSSRPCEGRVAVNLHMLVGGVVFSPRQIRCVRPQLAIHGAPIRSEPSIKIIKVYRIVVFCLDVSLDRQLYGGLGSSELPVRKAELQLYASEIGRKTLRLHYKILNFDFQLLQFPL